MFKKVLLILALIIVCSNSVLYADQSEFKFSNWPLDNFDGKNVLTAFSNKHFGIDIESIEGSDVKAVSNGVVYWTYSGGAHGVSVGIEHENGLRTTYLHLSERFVKKGQIVESSEIIGKTGITGTGRDVDQPHLHFALIKDAKLDISNPNRYGNPLLYAPITEEKQITDPVPDSIVEPEANLINMPVLESIDNQITVGDNLQLLNQKVHQFNYIRKVIKTNEKVENEPSNLKIKNQANYYVKSFQKKSIDELSKARLVILNYDVLEVAQILKSNNLNNSVENIKLKKKVYILKQNNIDLFEPNKILIYCILLFITLLSYAHFSDLDLRVLKLDY